MADDARVAQVGRSGRRARANPDGNGRLTAALGVLLLVQIAVELATVLLGVHTFMSVHVFIGLLLIPLVLLKLASTGWRFTRYYTRNATYVAQGPPRPAMRLLAPVLVAATVVLLVSGVAMGFLHGHDLVIVRRLHGPASAIWIAAVGLHIVVYLKRSLIDATEDVRPTTRASAPGATKRAAAVAAGVVAGLVLAAVAVPAQHRWINIPRDHHDHHQGRSAALDRARPRERAALVERVP